MVGTPSSYCSSLVKARFDIWYIYFYYQCFIDFSIFYCSCFRVIDCSRFSMVSKITIERNSTQKRLSNFYQEDRTRTKTRNEKSYRILLPISYHSLLVQKIVVSLLLFCSQLDSGMWAVCAFERIKVDGYGASIIPHNIL